MSCGGQGNAVPRQSPLRVEHSKESTSSYPLRIDWTRACLLLFLEHMDLLLTSGSVSLLDTELPPRSCRKDMLNKA